jgi:hypothetical protein
MFPNNLWPMPLKRHRVPFSKPDWIYEIKHDGFRALAFVQDGSCRLVSRNGKDFRSFGTLTAAIPKHLKVESAVLDGEIVCLDEQGRSQFNELLFRRGVGPRGQFQNSWEGPHLNRKVCRKARPHPMRREFCNAIADQSRVESRLQCGNVSFPLKIVIKDESEGKFSWH